MPDPHQKRWIICTPSRGVLEHYTETGNSEFLNQTEARTEAKRLAHKHKGRHFVVMGTENIHLVKENGTYWGWKPDDVTEF